MKRIMKPLICFYLFFMFISLSAQVYDPVIAEQMDFLRREKLMPESDPKAYRNIDGTPYLEDEFEEGRVYLKSGEVFAGKCRIDLFANQVQFLHDGRRYVIAHPDRIYKIELNGYDWKYVDYRIDAGIDHDYFISLVEGYYSLFLLKSKTLKDPRAARPYQQPRPAKFLDHKDLYYLQIGDKPAQRVRNKRAIVKLCDEQGPEVKKYIKTEGINVRKEQELIKLVSHINEEILE